MEKFENKNEYENCVVCHKQLNIRKDEDIYNREYYVEGTGQLCIDCYHKLFNIIKSECE